MEREFFASHTVSELRSWSDYALEAEGRLVEPMAYDAGTDTYVPIAWADAFALVGETLRGLDSPNQASFYPSGRLSNEATFLYQLWVREFGTNNLPDVLVARPAGRRARRPGRARRAPSPGRPTLACAVGAGASPAGWGNPSPHRLLQAGLQGPRRGSAPRR